jgi:hypothetical protein
MRIPFRFLAVICALPLIAAMGVWFWLIGVTITAPDPATSHTVPFINHGTVYTTPFQNDLFQWMISQGMILAGVPIICCLLCLRASKKI